MLRTTLVLLLFFVANVAHGQISPAPSLTTIPSPPVAGRPFVIDAGFLGGGTPTFAFVFAYVSSDTIAISGLPASPPVFGHVLVPVPAMQAGTYLLQFTTVGFSPRPDYANFQLIVAPQGAPAPIPMLDTSALLLCALAIALAGGAALMRRPARK